MSTALFLGAGASYEFDMPLVCDLTTHIKKWLTPEKLRWFNSHARRTNHGHPDEVVDTLIQLLKHPELHYESILGHLELQYIRHGGHGVGQSYRGMYEWLINIVYLILYRRHVKRLWPIAAEARFFDGIVGLADQNRPLWVFSLNHDVLIECIASEFDIPVESGFPGEIKLPTRDRHGRQIGELVANTINGDEFDSLKMRFLRSGAYGINLLKIHGALDIFAFRDGKDLLKLRPVAKGASGVIESLRMANDELLYVDSSAPSGRVHVTNEIVYADASGEMQFLQRSLLSGAFKFNDRYRQVIPKKMLDYLRRYLRSVNNLIVVGCGLGDAHINNVLREWLEASKDHTIEIVGPGVRRIPLFILHLAPQVVLHDATASDFFARFSKRPLSMREKAVKELQKASRDAKRRMRGYI